MMKMIKNILKIELYFLFNYLIIIKMYKSYLSTYHTNPSLYIKNLIFVILICILFVIYKLILKNKKEKQKYL